MPIAHAIAVIAIFVAVIWLGRLAMAVANAVSDAYLRWKVERYWARLERAARAHHRSGRFLDDYRPPLSREAVDAEFEDVGRP